MIKVVLAAWVSTLLGGCFASPNLTSNISSFPDKDVSDSRQSLTLSRDDQNWFFVDVPEAYSNSFIPVPINKLNNYSSLHKGQTNSEFKLAYEKAIKLVTPLAGLSRKQQLAGIAKLLRTRFDTNGTYSTKKAHYNNPYGFFVLGVASCAGSTRAVGLCLNILGIPYEHINENKWGHQWCRVKIDGQNWICDPFGVYVGPESGMPSMD